MILEEKNSSNIGIVIDLLKEHNIRKIVISPGGTNIPFVRGVQDDPFFTCYSVVDERSAVYFAIGLYLQSGETIALSCTSAQATRNYIPGLTEAFYKHVPLLAITMEKHPRFHYQDYMQAPDQTSLPNDCVKHSYELPFICDKNSLLYSIRVANEAFLEIKNGLTGPVQLCIPAVDFELGKESVESRHIHKYRLNEDWNTASELEGRKVMIVVGENRGFDRDVVSLIDRFCDGVNGFVYVNHLSNFKSRYSLFANTLLEFNQNVLLDKKYTPDIIISIGGQTGDYPIYKYLSKLCVSAEHWRVSPAGDIVDTYDKLTKVFECDVREFFEKTLISRNCDHSYFEDWKQLNEKMQTDDVEVPFSNIYAAQKLHGLIPANSSVQFSILNSLRVWSYFDFDESIKCFSNVGAFGIDGGMSTLIGQSVASDEMCFAIIGDLAFLYDINSIAIRHIKSNLRILLINNNGGFEFKQNIGANAGIDKYIAAAGHFKSAEGWAKTCGFEYLKATGKEEFDKNIASFLEPSQKPVLFEVTVSDQCEADAFYRLTQTNTLKGGKDMLVKELKHFIKSKL